MKLQLTLPTKINEIKLEQWQKFYEISKNNEESEFLYQKMISIFCNVDMKDVAKLKYKDLLLISKEISDVLNEKTNLVQEFILNGITFGFIPNLEDMSSGEYIDLDTYITDVNSLHKAMAVLYRPITKKLKGKYSIESYIGSDMYANTMRDMPLGIALGAYLFFWTLGIDLLNSTIHYLENNKQLQDILKQNNLGLNGDGINQYTRSLAVMLEDFRKSLNFQLNNV